MVDEGEYQQTFHEVNHSPCVFGRAMLANCCRCQHGQRIHIAEREAMACLELDARQRCKQTLAKLREISRFALKLPDLNGQLPHAQALRLQCASLRGLRAVLANKQEADDTPVANVAALLLEIEAQPQLLENPLVIQSVVAFKGRKRRQHPSL